MSFVAKLNERGILTTAPKFLYDNTHFECIMGSMAYGCNNDDSDWDIYGFCIPHKEDIFPHLRGEIMGFGRQLNRFEQFQQHHIDDKEKGKQYDVTIFSIVKYFHLVMENNPNMIDSLFVPQNLILSISRIGNMVRDKRQMFLHKGAFRKFKEYAFAQLHKMKSQNREGKRADVVAKFGYDLKFASHVIRLLDECEQIMQEQDLNLQRSKEMLKSVRRGDWKLEEVEDYFTNKEKYLEKLYEDSKLPYSPDEEAIKQLLLNCLEEHFGNLENAISNPDKYKVAVMDIRNILESIKE